MCGLIASAALATPSSTYWTVATTDVQPYRVAHLGVDNYFTVARSAADGAGDFPTDVGLTVGVLPGQRIQMEIGVDALEPTDHPVYFNAKLGVPENVLDPLGLAFSAGAFNVGTAGNAAKLAIAHVTLGKTVPGLGRVFAGAYIGNRDVLRDARGEPEEAGLMVAFDRGFSPVQAADGTTFNRFVLAADWASGHNAIGAGGIGLAYFFSSSASLLTGPVFFNEKAINGEWKWTTQLDANLPF